ncbi:MAG TPA: ABC transporter permease subunit [Planctomycetia bacterium]|nr:ABC transporter permease subunit [Planctomycetia bacterium]
MADRAEPDYRGVLSSPVTLRGGAMAVARWTLRPLFRRWAFWLIVALGAIGFLTNFALIYIKAEIAVQNVQLANFLDRFRVTGTGEAYRDFLRFQARAVILMLAYVGVAALANDYRAGGVAFYLARPIGRRHYILGKSLALAAILALLTLVPGLLLFIAYGVFANSPEYWWEEWRLARGIVGYSLVIMTVPSVLLVALSTVLRRSAPLLLVWTAIFIILPALGFWMSQVLRGRGWNLVSLWYDLGVVGQLGFGALRNEADRPFVPVAAGILVFVVAGSLIAIVRNLRAVEVVQ